MRRHVHDGITVGLHPCLISTLFLTEVFKGKIVYYSIMDTIDIHEPTRQIIEFSTFTVSSAVRQSLS